MDLSLTEIANEEATDKGTLGPTPNWQCHNYTDIYEAYLRPFRNKKINLLEVGLGVRGPYCDIGIAQGRNMEGGASMKMWYRYFKEAKLWGIDINPAKFLDNDRITTARVDQGDPEQLELFLSQSGVEKFDVIIDDGSHWPHHQQITLGVLFPRLAEGGLYIIEDLLANGKDDPKTDPSVSVLNTRKVLRSLLTNGEFASPHALIDTPYLKENIESTVFHCPNCDIQWKSKSKMLKGFIRRFFGISAIPDKAITTYLNNTENMCVIRKKINSHAN